MHEKDERGYYLSHCIVITRNGNGPVWRFFDRKAARLHPISQSNDVYAASGSDLVEQYGKGLIDDLLRFAEGRDRVRLVDAFEQWRSGVSLSSDIVELLWHKVYQASATPPADPAEIIRLIKEDRLFCEDRVLRSIGAEERSSITSPVTKPKRSEDMTDVAARKRVDENATITVQTEEGKNPKRAGSKAYDRFALYQDGMTVKEAKAAGVQATDISYDSSHGFITLTPGEAPAAGEEAGEEASDEEGEAGSEAAPKKKSRRAA